MTTPPATPLAVALPIQPGKVDAWKAFVAELTGPREGEYRAHQMRCGVSRAAFFHQPTPEGEIAIMVLEARDPAAVIPAWLASQNAFDKWFLGQLDELHGLTREILPFVKPGMPVGAWPPAAARV